MSTDFDTTKVVRAWLRADDHDSAERLLAEVVASLETTPQRRRIAGGSRFLRQAIAVAAVIIVAIIAARLLPGGTSPSVGGPGQSPSPSPLGSVGPSASVGDDFWATGPYEIGRHQAQLDGIPFSFDVPAAGWSGDAMWTGMLDKSFFGWVGFTWVFDEVATDPCAVEARTVGPSVDDLATAMTTIPGTTALPPTDATVGGLPAKVVEFSIDDDIPCDAQRFMLFGEASAYPNSTGSTIKVWIFEVNGKRTGIHTDRVSSNLQLEQEIQQIVDSVRFE